MDFDVKISPTDEIICIRHVLDKKWEYRGKLHQLFTDFMKAYDSIRKKYSKIFSQNLVYHETT
jgi:hypothetical protein